MKRLGTYSRDVRNRYLETDPSATETELVMELRLGSGATVKNQIMQAWERPYMQQLSRVASGRGGTVLEVGYGMGIATEFIQQADSVVTHVLIECHPAMCSQAKQKWRSAIRRGRMQVMEGFWEDITPSLPSESFDGILFDSCPLDKSVELFHFFPFFPEAHRLLKTGGVFTYFSDEPHRLSSRHRAHLRRAGFRSIAYDTCNVQPPPDCNYWKEHSIVVPIVHKLKKG